MKTKISSLPILIGSVMFLCICCGKEEKYEDPVADIEGNIYKTVKIGTQVWMAENLKSTLYNDGTEIPLVTRSYDWEKLKTPAHCLYNNSDSIKNIYGALYNAYAVNTEKLCPTGWHIPDREELLQLIEFLGDSIASGGKLKETGLIHWKSPNKGADNSSGFTALPAGIRYFEGSFSSIMYFTSFWLASDAEHYEQWYISLYFGDADVLLSHSHKKHGFSVRCIKD